MKKLEPKKPGRPVLPPEQAQTAMIRERVTEAQKAEYEQRGGKAWLVRELSRKPRKWNITPEISRRRSALIDLLYGRRKNICKH